MESEKKSLADIQLGDYVRVSAPGEHSYIAKVTRVTAKQLAVGNGDLRFWKESGYSVGTYGYRSCYHTAEIASEEDYQEFEDRKKSIELMCEVSRSLRRHIDCNSTRIPSSVVDQWLEVIRSYEEG